MSLNDGMLVKIAKLYYEEKMTQEEIAKEIFISRSQVSRALKKCVDKGIIEVVIKSPIERTYNIEREFITKFNLLDVYISKSYSSQHESIKKKTFQLAANYIRTFLKNKMSVGITWGKTLRGVVDEINSKKTLPETEFIQLAGNISTNDPLYSGSEIAKDFAYKFNSKYYQTNCELFVNNITTKRALIKTPNLKLLTNKYSNINVAIFSLGNLMSWSEILDKKIYNELIRKKVVGHVIGYFIDINGNFVDSKISQNSIAIDKEIIKNKKVHKIVIAFGIDKAEVILAALKSKLISTLITDYHTALKILDLYNNSL